MKLECIFTGNELLTGSTVNTNISELGKLLTANGLEIGFACTCRDSRAGISRAIASALDRADTVIICGGLGGTSDDLTIEAASRFFGLKTSSDPELEEKVRAFWAQRHTGHCPKFLLKQALLPETARKIPNDFGSATGIAFDTVFDGESRRIYLTPGPPHEFLPMMENYIVPELCERAGSDRIFTLGFLACGSGEAKLSTIVRKLKTDEKFNCAYTACAEGCRFYISGTDKDAVTAALEEVRANVGDGALDIGELSLEAKLISLMSEKGLTLSTAESCTGGLISALITDVPGASAVYMGSAVTYSNEMKERLLGVPHDTLENFGAVSAETAEAMAAGACRKFGTDASIAVTGIAGPGGGTPEKPVGLVYVGVCFKGKVNVIELRLRGTRSAVRERTRACALLELFKAVSGEDTECWV